MKTLSAMKAPLTTLLLAAVLGLAACGGGGGGGSDGGAPPTTTLTLAFRPVSTFHFAWTDVAGETSYRLLENPDGTSGYSQVALIGADSTSHDLLVSLPRRVNASYILQACSGGSCADVGNVSVSGSLASAVGYVKASNTGANDLFGGSIALSGDGNTLAVAAVGESSSAQGPKHPGDPDYASSQADDSAFYSGAVYVFLRTGTTWTQQAYLKAWNAAATDFFGSAIAVSADGNTLAVGASREDSNGVGGQVDDSATDSGAVYVFTRSGDTWFPAFYVKAANAEGGDYFGESLALSGDGGTLAVGAPREDSGIIDGPEDNSVANSGAVYVFVRDASFWFQQAYLKAPIMDPEDLFGTSLALSHAGNTLAVGVWGDASNSQDPTDNTAEGSGAVYVFTRDGNTWLTPVYLKAPDPDEGDRFGFSLALSGDGETVAVGAPFEDSDGTRPSDNSVTSSGAVYVFARAGDTWTGPAHLKASNLEAGDWFGWAVALSGDGLTLASSAVFEDSSAVGVGGNQDDNSIDGSGAVYLFFRFADAWLPPTYVKASNTNEADQFGSSLSLSGDGGLLAVGTGHEDGGATGTGGDASDNSTADSGAAYLY